ncbi:GDSL-type esterase/lipase family protein [Paenibacillus sp. HB172176]|uniref:SGNH/GDSL hydrolase family protein n=1 Tax=Paenibacillus sp. HB172176 TaxID=2493690 RepID=UPI001438ED75|nr:GDSL-type esterase/lipase family protein [Paenibacillus sp. HB172176]
MIRDGIYFHNVTELESFPYVEGLFLRRYPREIRHILDGHGRVVSEEATGCELRFVTSSKQIRITLGIPEKDSAIRIYKGGMFHSEHRFAAGSRRTLLLEEPAAKFGMVNRKHLLQSGFAPEVWRVCFGRSVGIFYDLNTFGHEVRPPRKEEMPRLRWLAYGSSITHGPDNASLSYVSQAARRLKVDVLNAGLSGSCLFERETAEFLANRDDWDFASFELGINMRDDRPEDVFRSRSRYLLEQVIARHPDKHLFLITIYPNFATFADTNATRMDRRFNEILRSHAEELNHPNLHLIEGDTVMTDMSAMTCDLVHPSEYGHMVMGENLAKQMGPYL